MAASATDKARKTYSYLQKTLNGGIDDNDTTLTPNNVTNVPTDTGVSFVVDRVDSNGTKTPNKRELMTGVVSGGTITNLSRGEQGTTAQAHSSGAVLEFVNSGEMWNDLIDFLLTDHLNPSGYHSTLHDSNGNEMIEFAVTGSAVNHLLTRNAATGNTPKLEAAGDDTNINLHLKTKGTGEIILVDGNGNEFSLFDYVASAVNYLGFVPSATGNPLQIQSLGDDTNISLWLKAKGTGTVQTGRPVAFRLPSTQSITNGASADLVGTEDFDYGSNLDQATGVFTAPYAGVYFFTLSAGFDNTTNTSPTAARIDSSILKNGTTAIASGHGSAINTNADPHASTSCIVLLAAGDTVKANISNNTGGTEALTAGSHFAGALLGRTD